MSVKRLRITPCRLMPSFNADTFRVDLFFRKIVKTRTMAFSNKNLELRSWCILTFFFVKFLFYWITSKRYVFIMCTCENGEVSPESVTDNSNVSLSVLHFGSRGSIHIFTLSSNIIYKLTYTTWHGQIELWYTAIFFERWESTPTCINV